MDETLLLILSHLETLETRCQDFQKRLSNIETSMELLVNYLGPNFDDFLSGILAGFENQDRPTLH
jgi:hypothetical protein